MNEQASKHRTSTMIQWDIPLSVSTYYYRISHDMEMELNIFAISLNCNVVDVGTAYTGNMLHTNGQ